VAAIESDLGAFVPAGYSCLIPEHRLASLSIYFCPQDYCFDLGLFPLTIKCSFAFEGTPAACAIVQRICDLLTPLVFGEKGKQRSAMISTQPNHQPSRMFVQTNLVDSENRAAQSPNGTDDS
jgi:hypothetical protein